MTQWKTKHSFTRFVSEVTGSNHLALSFSPFFYMKGRTLNSYTLKYISSDPYATRMFFNS